MILRMLEVGPLMVNCYIVGDEESREAAVFDPGGDVDAILQTLARDGLRVKYILNTHCHFDHVGGNDRLQKVTGAPLLVHKEEEPLLGRASERATVWGHTAENSVPDRFIQEGDEIAVGKVIFKVLDVRGHSPGGLAFYFEGEVETDRGRSQEKLCITGDALFAGSIGRTDIGGGNLDLLLDNIRKKLFTLPEETWVLPGHGPMSTIGREKRFNPFFA